MAIEIKKPLKIKIKEEGILLSEDIDTLDFDSAFTLVDQGDGSVTIEGGSSSGTGKIEAQDENVVINSNVEKINFGRGLIVTNNATDKVTIDSNGVYYRVVTTEAELVATMNELNLLGGGAIQFTAQIGLTQNRTFNFNNIRWIGNTSNDTALKLNGYKITIASSAAFEGGAYFQNFRFLGENGNATGFNQQVLNTSETTPPLYVWFDNCFFKNIISRSDTTYVDESQATTDGVVLDVRNGATTIIFENVDWHNNGIIDSNTSVRHAPFTIWARQGIVTRINVLGQYSQYTARNRYRLMPPSGSPSSGTYIELATDGSAVHYGPLPVVSAGKVNQSLVQNPESKQIFYIASGSTLTFEPNDNPIGEGLAVIDSTAGNTNFTLPSVLTSGSGFHLNFINKGNNTCTINANVGQTIDGLSQYLFSGNLKFLTLYYEKATNSWFSWRPETITVSDTSSLDLTRAGDNISGVVLPAGVNHNALQNYVANQHVDHSAVSILAGAGLTGGGNLTANRTLALTNSGVTPGTYGNTTNYPIVTVDTYGRVTSVSTAPWSSAAGLQLIDYRQSLSLSTTTSTNWQTKINFTTASLIVGTYRIGWSYAWYYTNTSSDFQGRVRVDGSDIMEHRQEPQDPGSDQRHRTSGFLYVELSAGTHVIELNWRSSDSSYTAGITEASIEIMKG